MRTLQDMVGIDGEGTLAVVEASAVVTSDHEQIDWDSLQIVEPNEEQGRFEICNEEQLYVLLGLRDEDERAEQEAREAAPNPSVGGTSATGVANVEGAAIPVDDYVPEETKDATPNRPAGTREQIMQESPGMVTRRHNFLGGLVFSDSKHHYNGS